jgi:hypothetical protein
VGVAKCERFERGLDQTTVEDETGFFAKAARLRPDSEILIGTPTMS